MGKTILVVDDDIDLTEMLKLRLEAEGFIFTSVKDGREMLDVVKENIPDLILLDVMLPKMDGYSALREMRKEERCKDIPVIVLTAKEKAKLGDLFALEKVSFFVEKPFEIKELLNKIREAI